MKIFPTNNYKIELKGNSEKMIEFLRLNTLKSNSLSTKSTNKEFIGRINENNFEIISSEIGIGAFIVLRGNFSEDTINVIAELNKPFKVLISILFIFGITGITFSSFQIGFPKAFGMLIPLAMFVGFIKYIFLGLLFKVSSNLSYGKLSRLLSLELNKNYA